MARRHSKAIAALLVGALLVGTVLTSSEAHVILDGEIVHAVLVDVTKYLTDTQEGVTEEVKLEALYLLGEKTQHLVDLMNLDLMSHGKSLYAELIVKRLQEYRIRVTFVERNRRYVYDLAAFHEYLKKSPRGRRAADIGFRLIADAFYGSAGKDAAELVNMDAEGLRKAILQKEVFLKEYSSHEKVKEIRFFLAMDYYRLYKNSPDPATAKKYEKLSVRALQEIVKEYPGTAEARAAEVTLGRLQRAGGKD